MNDIIIHDYSNAPGIAKALVNFRRDRKIYFRAAVQDLDAARAWLNRIEYAGTIKVVRHESGMD